MGRLEDVNHRLYELYIESISYIKYTWENNLLQKKKL